MRARCESRLSERRSSEHAADRRTGESRSQTTPKRSLPGGRCHVLTRMWRESLAAPVDAKAFATAFSSGGTSFAACGDGLSDQGASEHEAKCPRGVQQRSRHVRDALPE